MAKANHNSSKPKATKLQDPPEAFKRAIYKYIDARLGSDIMHPDYLPEGATLMGTVTGRLPDAPTPSAQYNFPGELHAVVAMATEFNRIFEGFVEEMVGPIPKTDEAEGEKLAPINCYMSDLKLSAYTLRQLNASNLDLFKRLREYL